MAKALPVIYLARHGDTAWTVSGQHTGRTDLPLTERGEDNARALGTRLHGLAFAKIFTSPLQRASRTCQLAGFGSTAERDPDLMEWDYGEYEGRRTAEIHVERPHWQLFRDGCPGGESPTEIGARADRLVGRVRRHSGRCFAVLGRVFSARACRSLARPRAGWWALLSAGHNGLLRAGLRTQPI